MNLYEKRVKLFPRPRHVMSVGEPIDLHAFRDREPDPRMLREMTDVIMRRLRADLAELRGEPAPQGDLFVWRRARAGRDDAA